MLKNDTLKNGTSCTGLYGSAPSSLFLFHLYLLSIFMVAQMANQDGHLKQINT